VTTGLIWDMDGVLVNSGQAHYLAWRRLFDELGLPLTAEQVRLSLGMSNLPLLRAWLGETMPNERLLELGERKEVYFRSLISEHVCVLPGVRAWLARAREFGYAQAIASSAPMANIVAIVSQLGLADAFSLLVSGTHLPASKPDPAIFLLASRGLGCDPAACVVLEDSTHGVQAARRAGMPCVAITNTRSAADLAGASLVVSSLDDLAPDTFEKMVYQRPR